MLTNYCKLLITYKRLVDSRGLLFLYCKKCFDVEVYHQAYHLPSNISSSPYNTPNISEAQCREKLDKIKWQGRCDDP